jgi:lysozyme
LIARFEGWVPSVYMCPAGYPTIGYGHYLISCDKTLSPEQCLELFKAHVRESSMSPSEKDEVFASLNLNAQLTEAGGLALLQSDIRRCANVSTIINPEVLATLAPGQIDSLASLTFNLGIVAIRQSTVVRLINEGKSGGEVADWISPWRKANGTVMVGLQKRRLAEAMIFLGVALDLNSDEASSVQWKADAMNFTDENWKAIWEADKAKGRGLLKDAIRIYEEYMALDAAA